MVMRHWRNALIVGATCGALEALLVLGSDPSLNGWILRPGRALLAGMRNGGLFRRVGLAPRPARNRSHRAAERAVVHRLGSRAQQAFAPSPSHRRERGARRADRMAEGQTSGLDKRRLTTVGADSHAMVAAASPPHFMECLQHNQTLGIRGDVEVAPSRSTIESQSRH